ncbi:Scramblase-domain-containing protein [Gorgonomyces haynaldii]|nr:Scramblase-domain-containing protein [Gorgonomyces haynaldii]
MWNRGFGTISLVLGRTLKRAPVYVPPRKTQRPLTLSDAPRSELQVPNEFQKPVLYPPRSPSDVLQTGMGMESVFGHACIVIVRQFEAMEFLLGVEEANRYAISNIYGQHVGYIAEESSTFKNAILRQLFRNRRKLEATVYDQVGNPILHIERPFKWFLNSHIKISHNGQLIGEVKQRWHLWRRKYDLFVQQKQFAKIDGPLLTWDFELQNEKEERIGSINRSFTGFMREIFTDTGHYMVQMDSNSERHISLDERAVMLACAMTADVDYFDRQRQGFMSSLFYDTTMDSSSNAPVTDDQPDPVEEKSVNQWGENPFEDDDEW